MRTMFDQAKAEQIVERVWQGKSLRAASAEIGVKHNTFLDWAASHPHLGDQYARAIAERADIHADRIERIVDKVESGELTPEQARAMTDPLKWIASKLNPKRYGDKLQVDQDVRLQVELIDATAAPVQAQITAQTSLPAQALLQRKMQEDPS